MCSTDGLLKNLIFRGSKELIEFFYYISLCVHFQLSQNWTQKEELSFLWLFLFPV